MAYRNWALCNTDTVAVESMVDAIQPAITEYDNNLLLIENAKAAIEEIKSTRNFAIESFHHTNPVLCDQSVSKIVDLAKANKVTIQLACTESRTINVEQRFDMIRELEVVAVEGLTARIGALLKKAKEALVGAFKRLFSKVDRAEHQLNKLKTQLKELNSTDVQRLDIKKENSNITVMCRYEIDYAIRHMAECDKFLMGHFEYAIDDDGYPKATKWRAIDSAMYRALPQQYTNGTLTVLCIPGNVFLSYSRLKGKAQAGYSTARYLEADMKVLKSIADSDTFKIDGKEAMQLVDGGLHIVESVYRGKDKWEAGMAEFLANTATKNEDTTTQQALATTTIKAMLLSYANCIDGTQSIAADYIKATAK